LKRNTRRLPQNPFVAWSELMWKVAEISSASAEVIAHRTTRLASAGPMPGARDRREFTRMGQEKFETATECAAAVAGHLTAMNLQFGTRAFGDAMNAASALMALGTSRTVSEVVTRQVKLADALSRSVKTAVALSGSTAGLAGRGLTPIHSRATANARRLRKR
jgi:hypothetical protein